MEELDNVGFVLVTKEDLQYNHARRLSFWLTEDFVLFRNKISVDNYLAIDVRKGWSQFYPFAMCRESSSNDYMSGSPTAYYLTAEQAKAIVEYIEKECE